MEELEDSEFISTPINPNDANIKDLGPAPGYWNFEFKSSQPYFDLRRKVE